MKKYKWVLIGGAGAIGNNLILNILNKENVDKILILDNLSSGSIKWLPKSDYIEFCYCDIYDFDKLSAKLRKFCPHFIFNLAAHFANQNSVDFPLSDLKTNVIGNINLLEISKKLSNLKKIVFTSSSCLYGSSEYMSESDFLYPSETPYAINKFAGELYTKYYSHQFNIPTINLRLFNSYGPYELAGKYRNVIPNFIEKAINGSEILITGNGEETRDFTYVEDICNGLLLACKSEITNGDVFNLGSSNPITINELAKKIILISNSKSKIKYVDRRIWDTILNRNANISKAKKAFGYNPIVDFDKGLEKTYNWLKKEIY